MTASMPRGTPDGADDPREVLEHLLEEWPEPSSTNTFHQPAARRGKSFVGKDVARVSAVIGLVKHAHDTARATALLLDGGHVNSAVALVRLTYEDALTAVWLVQSEDHYGITAFMHEYARGRRALQKDASGAASAVFREGAPKVSDADPSKYEAKVDSVQNFRQLCIDLTPGGVDAYLLYRVLSAYSHASVSVADLYLEEAPQGPQANGTSQKKRCRPHFSTT